MKKTLSVRVPEQLYTKVKKDNTKNCQIVKDALYLYYESKEPNKEQIKQENKVIEMLQLDIEMLNRTNNKLENKLEFYKIQTMSWWKRRIYYKTLKLLPEHIKPTP